MATPDDKLEKAHTRPPASDDQRHRALRALESRWVLPLAALGLLSVLILALYGVRITSGGIKKDGKLAMREAMMLERGGGLIGLSLEEALPLLDGQIIRYATDRGEMPAIECSDVPGRRLVMMLENGRIASVRVVIDPPK